MAAVASEDDGGSVVATPSLLPVSKPFKKSGAKSRKQKQAEKEEEERLAAVELERIAALDPTLDEIQETHCIRHGNIRQRLRHGMKYTMYCARFSPNNDYLATGSSDKTVVLWNLKTSKEVANYEHPEFVRSLDFSPDGLTLCTGCDDREARIWNVEEKTLITEAVRSFKHRDWIVCVCYSPNGKLLATVSRDQTVMIHDLAEHDAREAAKLAHSRQGSKIPGEHHGHHGHHKHHGHHGHHDKAKEGDERQGSKAEPEEPLDPDTRKFHHDDQTCAASFSRNNELLVTSSGWEKGHAIIFDVASLDELLRIPHSDWVTSAKFSPGGGMVLTTCRDKSARLWELPEGMIFGKELQDSKDAKEKREQERKDAAAGTKKLVISRKKQKELAEAAEREALAVSLEATETLKFDHLNWTLCAAFSPDGKQICTGCDTGQVHIYDTFTGEQLIRLEPSTESIIDVQFGPNGRKICTASADASARIYDGLQTLWVK